MHMHNAILYLEIKEEKKKIDDWHDKDSCH